MGRYICRHKVEVIALHVCFAMPRRRRERRVRLSVLLSVRHTLVSSLN